MRRQYFKFILVNFVHLLVLVFVLYVGAVSSAHAIQDQKHFVMLNERKIALGSVVVNVLPGWKGGHISGDQFLMVAKEEHGKLVAAITYGNLAKKPLVDLRKAWLAKAKTAYMRGSIAVLNTSIPLRNGKWESIGLVKGSEKSKLDIRGNLILEGRSVAVLVRSQIYSDYNKVFSLAMPQLSLTHINPSAK